MSGQIDDPASPAPARLAAVLRRETRTLHVQAERSGVIRDILGGRGTQRGYALLLRNLLPAYRGIETALDRLGGTRLLGPFARREMYRAAAIEADLAALYGLGWPGALPLLPEGERYAARVARAAAGDGALLIAHAYVRYLGDLSGGQMLQRLTARSLGVPAGSLAFYAFPAIADMAGFKAEFRAAIDTAAITDPAGVVAEAVAAFQLNIDVSEAVQAAVADAA